MVVPYRLVALCYNVKGSFLNLSHVKIHQLVSHFIWLVCPCRFCNNMCWSLEFWPILLYLFITHICYIIMYLRTFKYWEAEKLMVTEKYVSEFEFPLESKILSWVTNMLCFFSENERLIFVFKKCLLNILVWVYCEAIVLAGQEATRN